MADVLRQRIEIVLAEAREMAELIESLPSGVLDGGDVEYLRAVQDTLILLVSGVKGFERALTPGLDRVGALEINTALGSARNFIAEWRAMCAKTLKAKDVTG